MVKDNYKALEICLKNEPSFQIRYKGETLCALSDIETITPKEITCPHIEKDKPGVYKDGRLLAICKRSYHSWPLRTLKKAFNVLYTRKKEV